MTKKRKAKVTYIITEEFGVEWNKLTEEEKLRKFNEKYLKTIMKIEKENCKSVLKNND